LFPRLPFALLARVTADIAPQDKLGRTLPQGLQLHVYDIADVGGGSFA